METEPRTVTMKIRKSLVRKLISICKHIVIVSATKDCGSQVVPAAQHLMCE
jgi:hypothetical protein